MCTCAERISRSKDYVRFFNVRKSQYGPADTEINLPSVENTELTNVFPLMSGEGQNIASHASPTVRNFPLFLRPNSYIPSPFTSIFFTNPHTHTHKHTHTHTHTRPRTHTHARARVHTHTHTHTHTHPCLLYTSPSPRDFG